MCSSEEEAPASLATVLSRLGRSWERDVRYVVAKGAEVVVDGRVAVTLKRHAPVTVVSSSIDGDGNEVTEVGPPGCVRIIAAVPSRRVSGWMSEAALRSEDALDRLARDGPGPYEVWRKLASAVRTDNPVKLQLFLDKATRRPSEGGPHSKGREDLMARAADRADYHRVVHYCLRVDQLDDLREVGNIRDWVASRGDVDPALKLKVDAHGLFLADVRAVLGAPNDTSHAEKRGFAVDVDHLAWIVQQLPPVVGSKSKKKKMGLAFDPEVRFVLEAKLAAAKKVAFDRTCDDDDNKAHSVHVIAQDDVDGHYFRIIDARGKDDDGDKYDVHRRERGRFVYRNSRDPSLFLCFDGIQWLLGRGIYDPTYVPGDLANTRKKRSTNDDDDDDDAKTAATTTTTKKEVYATAPKLRGPWRTTKAARSLTLEATAPLVSVANFCEARLHEARITLKKAASSSPRAVAYAREAEAALAEAVALFREPGVPADLKRQILVDRADLRADTYKDLRSALADVRKAASYEDDDDDDEKKNPDALVLVAKARILALLGQTADAQGALKAALAVAESSSDVKRRAAAVKQLIAHHREAERRLPLRGAWATS